MNNNITILLIEDEALIAENIRLLLDDFGYTVSKTCYTYAAAAEAIEQHNFDLIISDIDLGHGIADRSGLQLLEKIKATKPCPFIFLTAYSDPDTIKKAAVLSPSAYLVKPVNGANLYAALQLAVENHMAQKTARLQEEQPGYFFTRQGNRLVKIEWADIYHLEAIKNYVRIKTAAYPSGVLLRGSLQQVLGTMAPPRLAGIWVRINRSEAVARSIIQGTDGQQVHTSHGSFTCTIPLQKLLKEG